MSPPPPRPGPAGSRWGCPWPSAGCTGGSTASVTRRYLLVTGYIVFTYKTWESMFFFPEKLEVFLSFGPIDKARIFSSIKHVLFKALLLKTHLHTKVCSCTKEETTATVSDINSDTYFETTLLSSRFFDTALKLFFIYFFFYIENLSRTRLNKAQYPLCLIV